MVVFGRLLMSEFDKWYLKEKYLGFDHIDHARAAYNAGQQSKQTEIDKLKSKNVKLEIQILQVQQSCGGYDSRDLLITELRAKIDKLQEINENLTDELFYHRIRSPK